MREKRLSLLCAVPFLFLFSIEAFSQGQAITGSDHVYVVLASGNKYLKGTNLQTGFRMQGTKGIITALHGVVGATSISAYNSKNDLLVDLTIHSVDINNDLALLSSKELQNRGNEGLMPLDNSSLRPGDKLKVLGHPSGIELYEKTVNAGNPIIKRLSTLISPNDEDFAKRKSPYEGIDVVNLEGNLVAGDSGAPVLDLSNRVIAIVDGGLLGGIAAISFAIPIRSIVWRDASWVKIQLAELAHLDPTTLFAFAVHTKPVGPLDMSDDSMKAASSAESARFFTQGGELFRRGQYAKASESFEQAIHQNSQNADYYFWLGYSRLYEQKIEGAEKAFRAAVRLSPNNVLYKESLGSALLNQHDWEEAETVFRDILRLRDGNGDVYCNLGHALYRQKKTDEAMKALQEGIRLKSGDIECRHDLGHIYLEMHQWKEAESLFSELIKLAPKKAEFHDHLGDSFAGQEKLKDAEAAYREAARLDPENENYNRKVNELAAPKNDR